jgi:putative addiction module component (TIGR02574 family)
MTEQAQNLMTDLRRLSESDRAAVVQQLIETLAKPDFGVDDQFEAELERRWEECLNDPSSSISWVELRDEQ